jgi:hypothetical protein
MYIWKRNMFFAMPRAETSRSIFMSSWGIKFAMTLKGFPFSSPPSLANFLLIVQLPPSGYTLAKLSDLEASEACDLFNLEALLGVSAREAVPASGIGDRGLGWALAAPSSALVGSMLSAFILTESSESNSISSRIY